MTKYFVSGFVGELAAIHSWDDSDNWSLSDGGLGGAGVPGIDDISVDDVCFTESSPRCVVRRKDGVRRGIHLKSLDIRRLKQTLEFESTVDIRFESFLTRTELENHLIRSRIVLNEGEVIKCNKLGGTITIDPVHGNRKMFYAAGK